MSTVKDISLFKMFKSVNFTIFFFKLLLLLAITNAVPSRKRIKLPAFVKICRRSDPQLSQCARNTLNSLKSRLNTGIPEIFIPPIEPLIIPEVRMDQDVGAIYMHSTYRNVRIYGLSNFLLDSINIDPLRLKISMTMQFPQLNMDALYEMRGKIMMMPLVGEGDCRANFTDVQLSTIISGEKFKKYGRSYIKIKDIKLKYTLGKAKIRFENLFNGDNVLGERMNSFINENWESLSEEIRPLMERAMAEVVRSSTEKLFETYSLDDLLPE